MRKTLAIILIILGLILISLPYISQKIIDYKTKQSLNLLDDLDVGSIKSNENLEAEFDFDSIRDIDPNSILSGINENYRHAMVGHLIISDVGINLPILKGTTDPHLLVGGTTMRPDQVMGQGNYPLAGHYHKNKDLLFGALMDVEEGMLVKITNKETIYEYKIYDTLVVPETAVYLIEDGEAEKRGKPVISLMSCYYTSKNGKRFFALGELVDEYPFDLMKLAD